MKKLTALIVAAFAFSAAAGTLNNQDAREYRLHLKSPGSEMAMPINTTTRVERTCNAFPCIVENEDTGEKVKLTCGDENLIIKDGHLAISMTDDAPSGGAAASAPAPAPSKPSKPAKAAKESKSSKHAAKAKASKPSKHARAAKGKKGNTVAMAE